MTRPPDPLQQTRDLPRGTELDDPFNMADIDAQLHRRRADKRPDLPPAFKPVLRVNPYFFGKGAVVHLYIAPFIEAVPQRLRGRPGIDKQQRGGIMFDALFHRTHLRIKGLPGKPDGDIHMGGCGRDIDNRMVPPGTRQKGGHLFWISHGGRQTDPLELPPGICRQTFKGDG